MESDLSPGADGLVVVSAERAVDELGVSKDDVANPKGPRRSLRLLRTIARTRRRLGIPPSIVLLITILLVLGLGTWGFHRLALAPDHLNMGQSIFNALKLFTLDLGPTGGGYNVVPDWQLYVAFLLAAAVVTRALFALFSSRMHRWVTAHHLRDHVIVCGAGVHGTELTKELSADHDVVLIDVTAAAPGLQDVQGHEWRLVGDATAAKTLEDAGVARAAWLVAITGNEYANSQIVTALESVKRVRRGLHVLVQVEHPTLARFLEESEEIERAPSIKTEQKLVQESSRLVVVSSFSPSAIAAEHILDEVGRTGDEPPRQGSPLESVPRPHIVLAGDHPMLDVIVLTALRRMRAVVLAGHEQGDKSWLNPTAHGGEPALRIGIYGPGAVARTERLEARWLPEAQVLALEPKEVDEIGDAAIEADDWLRKQRDSAQHVFVACWEEIDAIAMTLGISRALGDGVPVTRISALPANHLDRRIEARTKRSPEFATTMVLSLAELGCDKESISQLSARDRLTAALRTEPSVEDPAALAEQLFDRPGISIHTNGAWRVTPSELALVRPLVKPAPVGALVRASLQVNLHKLGNLRWVAEALSSPDQRGRRQGSPEDVFAAWCEYVRQIDGPARVNAGDRDEPADPGEPPTQLTGYVGDEIADAILRLRQASLGWVQAVAAESSRENPLQGARDVVMLAGGEAQLAEHTARRTAAVLSRALAGYRGTLVLGDGRRGVAEVMDRLEGGLELDEIRYPAGSEIQDSLTLWCDILSAGIPVESVRIIACAQNPPPLVPMVLARALGARIAWLDPSAELPLPLDDLLPFGSDGILELPADPMSLRAFLRRTELDGAIRDSVAAFLHGEYRVAQDKRKSVGDPALQHWDRLTKALRDSNMAQADDIPNKLAVVGLQAAAGGRRLELSEEQVELLAEIEHGRYNVERLEAGWQIGERQVRRLSSPHLKAWSDLGDDIKDYDREAVRSIAVALEQVGWGVEPWRPDGVWGEIG